MSARHRRANAHRRFAWDVSSAADGLMRELHRAVEEDWPHGSPYPPLVLLSDDQRDRLVRLRDRAEGLTRELHRLRDEVLEAATAHESRRLEVPEDVL